MAWLLRAPRRPRRGGRSPAAARHRRAQRAKICLGGGKEGVGRGRQPRSGKSQLHDDENVSKCASAPSMPIDQLCAREGRRRTLEPLSRYLRRRVKIGRGAPQGCSARCWHDPTQLARSPRRAAPSISRRRCTGPSPGPAARRRRARRQSRQRRRTFELSQLTHRDKEV